MEVRYGGEVWGVNGGGSVGAADGPNDARFSGGGDLVERQGSACECRECRDGEHCPACVSEWPTAGARRYPMRLPMQPSS